jgi:hypothetical protein
MWGLLDVGWMIKLSYGFEDLIFVTGHESVGVDDVLILTPYFEFEDVHSRSASDCSVIDMKKAVLQHIWGTPTQHNKPRIQSREASNPIFRPPVH